MDLAKISLLVLFVIWKSNNILHFEFVQMYPQGRMSHHFREMRVGDYLAVKGPKVQNMCFF